VLKALALISTVLSNAPFWNATGYEARCTTRSLASRSSHHSTVCSDVPSMLKRCVISRKLCCHTVRVWLLSVAVTFGAFCCPAGVALESADETALEEADVGTATAGMELVVPAANPAAGEAPLREAVEETGDVWEARVSFARLQPHKDSAVAIAKPRFRIFPGIVMAYL